MADILTKHQMYEDATSWRSLTVFATYRFLLAAILLAAFHLELPPEFLGESSPEIYNITAQLYFLVAVGLLFITVQRFADLETQVKFQLVIDIVLITVLIHASGGLKTSLGSLLVVVVVAGSVLVPGRLSIFIAAIATLAVLSEAVYSELFSTGSTHYSSAGILGATFFATAVLTQILSRKIIESQALAEARAADIANLAMLNSHIISRMQTGVLVVDNVGNIQLSNHAARQLLALSEHPSSRVLTDNVPELGNQLRLWRRNISRPFTAFQAQNDLPQVAVNAVLLESGESVLYIENTSAVAQQAQQLKLASLGQLTASIAHEIRNPLSAINHAAELLSEGQQTEAEITKLTDIIQRHSGRVNTIIETILEMSRRKHIDPSVIVLSSWLQTLLTEYEETTSLTQHDIALDVKAPLATAYLDQEQLRQVIWNLLDNASHYATPNRDGPCIVLRISQTGDEVQLDIIDNGPGVSKEMTSVLFEPFQSDRQGGTGLGLYLARELCQANGVRLNYIFDKVGKSCFSLHMPIKQQEGLK